MTASEAIFRWNMVISLLFNCLLLGSSNTEVGKAEAAAAQPTQGDIDKDDALSRRCDRQREQRQHLICSQLARSVPARSSGRLLQSPEVQGTKKLGKGKAKKKIG